VRFVVDMQPLAPGCSRLLERRAHQLAPDAPVVGVRSDVAVSRTPRRALLAADGRANRMAAWADAVAALRAAWLALDCPDLLAWGWVSGVPVTGCAVGMGMGAVADEPA
jgi:hypothetical protein